MNMSTQMLKMVVKKIWHEHNQVN